MCVTQFVFFVSFDPYKNKNSRPFTEQRLQNQGFQISKPVVLEEIYNLCFIKKHKPPKNQLTFSILYI